MDNFARRHYRLCMDKPLYPCGHCGVMFPRIQALRQGGYCQRCEFMTRAEVVEYLGLTELTVSRRLPVVRILRRVLIHRSDVEQMAVKLRAKKSWLAFKAA